jgi:hypothetical protein
MNISPLHLPNFKRNSTAIIAKVDSYELVFEGKREVHNDKLNNLDFSIGIIRMMKPSRTRYSLHGGDKKCTQNLVLELDLMRPLGRLNHRWDDNIKINIKQVRSQGVV